MLLLAELDLVQRRLADIDVAALDQFGHLPVKEGQKQRADVRAIHIRVRHDDDAVIAQLVRIELVAADTAAQRRDQGSDLSGREHLVKTRFFDIADLALERQDGLVLAVAPLLGRSAGRVALDQEELRQRRVLLLAVSELAGQPGHVEYTLPAGHFTGLARRFAGAGCLDDLCSDGLGLGRVLEQEVAQPRRHDRLDHRLHFR